MIRFKPQTLWIPLTFLGLFLAAVLFRPLMPIDETRYATVAWEMHLRHNWAMLTLNYAPYHHKPPLLFWMINFFWSLFGVHRWAATIPPVLAACASVYMTRHLALRLFPAQAQILARLPYIMIGSLPFLMYSTLVMFDVTLMAFVLAALLSMLAYARRRDMRSLFLLALFLGLGFLTKGPVALLYVIFPFLLAPLWMAAAEKKNLGAWYLSGLMVLLLALVPVLVWLGFALQTADHDFAFWLLWNQTAGRVTGNFSAAHVKPVYFYLQFIPALFLPWVFLPSFWKGRIVSADKGVRFLACWLVPVIVAFSLISGKQPHYLIPLLPGFLVLIALMLRAAQDRTIARVAAVMVAVLIGGQAVASRTILTRYDLQPVVAYMRAHADNDWAFVSNYHGEMGFLARREQPVEDVELPQLAAWFKDHPGGMAVVKYKKDEVVAAYTKMMEMRYRGGRMGVFTAPRVDGKPAGG